MKVTIKNDLVPTINYSVYIMNYSVITISYSGYNMNCSLTIVNGLVSIMIYS